MFKSIAAPLLARNALGVRPHGRNSEFHPPNRIVGTQGSIPPNQGGSVLGEYPCLNVRRLFPQDSCDVTCKTPDFYIHGVTDSFVSRAANREGLLALRDELEIDETRLWRGGEVRHGCFRGVSAHVFSTANTIPLATSGGSWSRLLRTFSSLCSL